MRQETGRVVALLFLALFSPSVVPVVEGSPSLDGTTVDVTVDENNAIGDQLGFVFNGSVDTVRYNLTGGDVSIFNIDSTTGNLTLNTVLDAEGATTVYKPEVIAVDSADNGSPVLTLTLTVADVNDNSPTCTPGLITYPDVDEGVGTGSITSLACSDSDKDSPNSDVEYAFSTAESDFSINTASGEITISSAQDYETTTTVTLKVDVSDKGATPLVTTATVILVINALNDESPSWNTLVPAPDSTGPDTYDIPEDTAIGTSLFTSNAADDDQDVGGTISYSIQATNEVPSNNPISDVFSIDPTTGEVYTQKALDADGSITGYELTLKASDGEASHDQTRTVAITLTDVNDNAPAFTNVPSSPIVISESNALTDNAVTTLTATDADDSPTLTFTVDDVILGNSIVADWKFDAVTDGLLEFAANIDYDAAPIKDWNVLKVVVTDEGGNKGTATVTVSISPVNEHDPTASFSDTSDPQGVSEDTAVGTSINRVIGADTDAGDDGLLIYSIDSGNTNDAFRINVDNGTIYVQQSLDRETEDSYSLVIGISDSGTSPKSIQKTLNIAITDVNDNTPTCTQLFVVVDVAEDEVADFAVTDLAALACTDGDGDSLTYTVLSPESTEFNVSGTELVLKAALDYETQTAYLVQIKVEDPDAKSTTVQVSVTVTAVNEDTPAFASNPSLNKPENSATGSLTTYTASDSDDSPHDIVSYSIDSVSNSGSSLFGIDSSTGEISLIGNLDYESLPALDKTYEIVVKVTDGGSLEGSGTVTVTVDDTHDSPPTCTNSVWNVDLDETQTGSGPWTVVAALGCSDPEGTTLGYSLQSSPSASFAVASDAVTLTADDLDYESTAIHVLTITVTDAGTVPQSIDLVVNVIVNNENDGPPVITATAAVDKLESLTVGSSIADINAIDPDGTDSSFGNIEYSIINGDSNNQFSIDVVTGEISLKKALDYETVTTYSLTIQAKEKVGGGANTATQVVNVLAANDVSPTCSPGTLYKTVPESSTAGYVIQDLSAMCSDSDATTGSTISFSITTGDATLFEISGTDFQLKNPLDFETKQSHDVSITVSDGEASHNFVLSGSITVGSVDDGQPVFTQPTYDVDVSESESVGYVVQTVLANDPDSSLDSNGQVIYSFVSSYSDFSIDSSSGQVSLAKELDRDAGTTNHELLVKAEDATGSVTCTVNVTVTDENDNAPVFNPSSYIATISESDPSGTTVVVVTALDADDPDTGDYGTVTYTLSGTGNTDFAIDSASGEITSATTMDADTTASYSLTVTATDRNSAAGALATSTSVVITVTKVNQNDPAFQSTPYARTITENELSIGDEILRVTATDADSGDNGEVTISFAVDQPKFNLVQTGSVASITLAEALDYENGDTSFSFNVQAVDGGSSPRTDTEAVTITVNDENDNNPLCTSTLIVSVNEGGTSVGSLTCSDDDAGTTLSYTVASTDPATITPQVSSTGVVTVTSNLDYEDADSYVIKIEVEDDGVPVKSTTVTINLYLKDLNDNDPTFSSTPFSFTIDETDSADGAVLLTVAASANDGPDDTVTYSVTGTTNFEVTADSGQITLKGSAPDYEAGSSTTFQVCASDTANPTVRSSCETVTVDIDDANDNTPIFSPAVYTADVTESTGTTTSIGQVTATDDDVSAGFNTISYSITGGNTGTAFSVGPSDGIVTVDNPLDYETETSYSLTIQASDGTLASTVKFEITITPVNEDTPAFAPTTKTVSVDEDDDLDTYVFTAAATDDDDGDDGELTYSIDSGPFSINPISGFVNVSGLLDRESTPSYTIKVYATDKGSPPQTGTLAVTFNINDVNDEDPSCGASVYTSFIAETDGAGTAVASLVCTDDDDDPSNINNDLTYTLTTHTSLFEVDTGGVVTVKSGAAFDRETTPTYSLSIDVVDKPATGKRTFVATVSVIITDVNDNDPSFTALPTTVDVEESRSVGSVVGSVTATDADDGLNGDVSYAITNGNTDTTFQIDAETGNVTLIKALDYESVQSYSLEITATDKGSSSRDAVGVLTVDVTDENDTPPVCSPSFYSKSLAEGTVSQAVATVACTDSDTVGSVSYSISAGDTNGDFEINSSTGVLTSKASANLDFESDTEITMTVTASDGVQSDTATVKVFVTDVNETPPTFDPSGPFTKSVSENETVGYSIMTLIATDADTGDVIKIFTISAGNSAAKFSLDPSTGTLTLQGPLDRETTPSYSLTVQVADSGGSTESNTVTIDIDDVNDNSPTCTVSSTALSVDEGVSSGDLYLPSCSDLDTVASPTLSYSNSSGDHAALSIDSSTGRLYLVGPFDYESSTSHTVVIEVSDQDAPTPKTTQLTVEISINPVNEHDPVFTAASVGPFNVSEDAALSFSIGNVSATDDDDGESHGTIRYSLEGGDVLDQFGVDESTGDIKVLKYLDRETTASYSLVIRASDDEPGSVGVRTADITTTVYVDDVNDETPQFSPSVYAVNVYEDATFGPAVTLVQLTVSDDDEGVNAQMDITITSGNGENKFNISGTVVTLVAGLDYETTSSYELLLEVADRGAGPLKSTARVAINVLPVNERAPLMDAYNSVTNASIAEDVAVGSVVYDANATDVDSGTHGQITYSIESGNTGGEFLINPSTGELTVSSTLDYDSAPNTYSIVIRATDGQGLSTNTSTVSLSITLTDVNDNYPQFPSSTITFSVQENEAVDFSVGTVTATDLDVGANGLVNYTKTGGSGSSLFDIDAATGDVTVIGDIDYETSTVYYLSIKAVDNGDPVLETVGLVKINVENMNDNDPVITPAEFAVLMSEDAISGTTALTYVAGDDDTTIDYFALVNADSFFQIDSSSGEVTTKALLDRETNAEHVLQIKVIDRRTSADATVRTSTANVTIIVEDVNDNDPSITGNYAPNVSEDASLNELVFTLEASDDDAGENAQLVFSIEAGDPNNHFRIDSSGNVQVNDDLDRETTDSYTITFKVTDKGTPPRADQMDITITVTDINDNDPVFTQDPYTMNVAENSNVGDAVGSVDASDDDAGVNAALTYSFDSFTVGDSSHFAIDAATGAITVDSTALDRETQDTYSVNVKAQDSGSPLSRSSLTVVNINIDDLNDNPPVFTQSEYTGDVDENSDLTTVILTVAATDVDIGVNADLTYSIDTSTADGIQANTYLEINDTTGEVSPKINIDYETITSFNMTVIATDAGAAPLQGSAIVIITVNDVNDNRPVFNPTFYNTEIAYNAVCDNSITTLSATDADSGVNAEISYSLLTVDNAFLLSVEAATGVVRLQAVASASHEYTYTFRASDNGNPILTSSTSATVRMDTFVPNNHVITIRLKLTRADFETERTTFMTNLQTLLRTVHAQAVPRIWCISEWSGTAVAPGAARRRLLSTAPVDVHIIALEDGTTDSQANVGQSKTILTQDQIYAILAADAQGTPDAALTGTGWDNLNIVKILQYYDEPEEWFDKDYGIAITVIACFLGLVLIFTLLYAIFVTWYRKHHPEVRRRKVRITEVSPSPEPPNEEAWKSKGVLPSYDNAYLAGTQIPPVPIVHTPPPADEEREPYAFTPAPRYRSPSQVVIRAESSSYSVVNRDFDGRAFDPESGRMYEYNTKTNERRWVD